MKELKCLGNGEADFQGFAAVLYDEDPVILIVSSIHSAREDRCH